ncbi:hypothetical protein EVAR_43803_1 [Eumeta japonica]|uniref:Uncharacterized protein n=1 Tax=Eumeta variegata TaxID=151549 RepID=A0A4C1XW53_EUMVA|nr:hypothetical protein EVAR_43803_1 [Eumeta japonica]
MRFCYRLIAHLNERIQAVSRLNLRFESARTKRWPVNEFQPTGGAADGRFIWLTPHALDRLLVNSINVPAVPNYRVGRAVSPASFHGGVMQTLAQPKRADPPPGRLFRPTQKADGPAVIRLVQSVCFGRPTSQLSVAIGNAMLRQNGTVIALQVEIDRSSARPPHRRESGRATALRMCF